MHGLAGDGARKWPLAAVGLTLLALVVWWLGFREPPPELVRDFEECVERVEAKPLSNDERGALMTKCYARFAGRRKPGGGYTYYDFMQDRSFDIAGPNLTADERKQIDREYMAFLDAQRRTAVSAELAKRRNEQFQADLERARQADGPPPPVAFMPRTSSPAAEARSAIPLPEKRPPDRPKSTRCEDASLTCGWAKLSAAVKNAFASSSRTNP
jgi:hypothetical protein